MTKRWLNEGLRMGYMIVDTDIEYKAIRIGYIALGILTLRELKKQIRGD